MQNILLTAKGVLKLGMAPVDIANGTRISEVI